MVINLCSKYNLNKGVDEQVKLNLTQLGTMEIDDSRRKQLVEETNSLIHSKAELTNAQAAKLKVISSCIIGGAAIATTLYQTGLATVYSEEHPITSKFFNIIRPKIEY